MATLTAMEQQASPDTTAYPPLEVGFARLVEDIVRHAQPLRVIAFGSRARGTHHPNSDLDLAIIVENEKQAEPLVCEARRMSRAYFAVDMLVITHDRQEWMKESTISVENRIASEGVVLYDRADAGIDYAAVGRLAR